MHGAAFRVLEKLNDGTEVTVRAIHAGDKERVLRAFRALEARSVYTRFFGAKRELTADDLRRLTEVDHVRDVALVVTIGSGSEETLIGGGRYVASEGGAEVAFTVEEDYQKKGVASLLLRHLVRIAREKGVARLEAFVLPENAAMLGVFQRSGLPVQTRREEGQVRVTLTLPA